MPGNPDKQTELTMPVTLPSSYRRWFQYGVREKRYRDGQWTGKYYEARYIPFLFPGISIKENANSEYIDVTIDPKTLPSACKAGQATLLQAIYASKSLSELSDNSDIKEKNANAIQDSLLRYLRPSGRFNHFENRLYGHFFGFLIAGLILSSVFGPAAILVLGFAGAVTGSFHHLFSWKRHINNAHEDLAKIVDETNKQLFELKVSRPEQKTPQSSLTECLDNKEKNVCIAANTSDVFERGKEKTVQESYTPAPRSYAPVPRR